MENFNSTPEANINEIKDFLKVVKDNYDTNNQYWFNAKPLNGPSKGRVEGDEWTTYMKRGSNPKNRGQKIVRKAGIESLSSECQRGIMFSMFGISQMKKPRNSPAYESKGGTEFGDALDNIIMANGNERWTCGNQSGPDGFPVGGINYWFGDFNNPVSYRNIENNKDLKSAYGVYDFYDHKANVLIELKSVFKQTENKDNGKSVWEDYDREEMGRKARHQLAIYITKIKERRIKGGWVLYLDAELDNLNPEDETTYRAYYMSKSEAQRIMNTEVAPVINDCIKRITWNHDNTQNTERLRWGTKSWFFAVINSIPKCGGQCCEASEEWFNTMEIREDWYIVSDY